MQRSRAASVFRPGGTTDNSPPVPLAGKLRIDVPRPVGTPETEIYAPNGQDTLFAEPKLHPDSRPRPRIGAPDTRI